VCLHDVLPGIRPRAKSALLGLPEDLADLLDLGQQFVRLGHVHAALGARGPGELGGLVEQLVQLRILLEMRRLEVVGPQDPQVVLDQLGELFLDEDRAGPGLGSVFCAYFSAIALTDSASIMACAGS
jgi:hypothetical protein